MSFFNPFGISSFSHLFSSNTEARFVPSSLCYYLQPLLLLSQRCGYRSPDCQLYLMLVFHYRFVLALFHWIGRILFDLLSGCTPSQDCEFGLLKRAHPSVMMVIGVGYGPQADRQREKERVVNTNQPFPPLANPSVTSCL